jgi:hypothetical protein
MDGKWIANCHKFNFFLSFAHSARFPKAAIIWTGVAGADVIVQRGFSVVSLIAEERESLAGINDSARR